MVLIKQTFAVLKQAFLYDLNGVKLTVESSKADYGLNRCDLHNKSVFGTSQDKFPSDEDAHAMQFVSKYCVSEEGTNMLNWLLKLTIQNTVVTNELKNCYSLSWNSFLMKDFNIVHDVVIQSLREISNRFLHDLMASRHDSFSGDEVYRKQLMDEMLGIILHKRVPILIFNYLHRFNGIFNTVDDFDLEWSNGAPLQGSKPLSYLYNCFCILPKEDGNIDFNRSKNLGINTESRRTSKILYEAITENSFFQDLVQLASFTNLTKERHDDILDDVGRKENKWNGSENYSFLFDVTKQVYDILKVDGKWQSIPLHWYPKSNPRTISKKGKKTRGKGKGTNGVNNVLGKNSSSRELER